MEQVEKVFTVDVLTVNQFNLKTKYTCENY